MTRTAWLASQDFRVLCFWNTEVLGDMTAVQEVIAQACAGKPPSPWPSPTVGGGDWCRSPIICITRLVGERVGVRGNVRDHAPS